jgi:hypothetical protein
VTQAVGLSSPETSAVAPAGVLEIEMFSVVPRVTDAQPTHGTAIAATSTILIIIYVPQHGDTFEQPWGERKGQPARALRYCQPRGPAVTLRAVGFPVLPSLFEPIHGIVSVTDSARPPACNTPRVMFKPHV